MQRSGDYPLKISYFCVQINLYLRFFRPDRKKMYVLLLYLHDSAAQQEKQFSGSGLRACGCVMS
ncbi:MAG TPA: helicase DnaB [Morganella sp. (in: Bacteria)]|nr:helicase DnaB [Morganella sp. (in: enterobacteria)]